MTAKQVKGNCHVYRRGDKAFIDFPKIDVKNTEELCIFCVGAWLPHLTYMASLPEGDTSPALEIRCPDPGPLHPGGAGSVVFEIERVKDSV